MAGGRESKSKREMVKKIGGKREREGSHLYANKPCQPVPAAANECLPLPLSPPCPVSHILSSFPPFPSLLLFLPLSVPQCITNSDRENGYNSSLQLPDATLNFAKKHPLMEDKALARPLLLTKGVNFTRLAVDRVSSLDQRAYNMLFIGTGTKKSTSAKFIEQLIQCSF